MFATNFSFAQPGLDKAFNLLLKENKRQEAASELTKLTSSPTEGPGALLTLALMESVNEHYPESFAYLQRFLEKSADPYPYIYAFWTSGTFNLKSGKTMLSYIDKAMKDPKTPSVLKAMFAANLASAKMNDGDMKETKALYDTYGEVSNWNTVGVFENVSGSGFNKDYGVLAHPEAGYVFKNSNGADVKWFPMDHNLGHWYDFKYHYDINNAVIYAQTFMKSPAARQAVLRVGVSGSFKIWINDYLVGSEAEERNTNMDVYSYVVNLKSGYNRILVQGGSAELSSNNYMIRFTDLNDQLMTDMESQADYAAYQKEQGYEVKKLPFFAEEFFEKRLKENPNSFIDLMMLISVYNQNDKKYEARNIARELKQLYPISTLVAERVTESYSRDNNNTDLTRELESIKTNDPQSLYGLILLYNDAIKKEDYKEAGELLQKREDLYGINKTTINNHISIYAGQKQFEEVLKVVNQAYEKYPADEDFATMEYYVSYNTSKDPKKAAGILKSYLDKNFSETIYNMLAANYLENGKKDDAFKMYRKYIDYFPFATNQYAAISDKYFAMQDYSNAMEWIDKAIERAPYVGNYHYKKGMILEAQGKKTDAMGGMKNAIRYNPGNFEARKKIRELQGKKDLFSSFNSIDIEKLVKSAPPASAYPNDNSIFLLEKMEQVVYPENGASEEKDELLIKVFNSAGIERWKDISLPYNYYTEKLIIEKAELFKKDGTKVQSENNDNEIVFSSLEVGDILHILYRKEITYSGKLAEHFWEEFTFNGGFPVKQSSFSLIVPRDKKFTYRMYNSALQPVVSDIDDYKMYVWEKSDIPAIKPESYMPAYNDINERIVVTSIPDWNYVANWYRDLSSVKTKADFEVKQTVKDLLQGKQNLTELQKAKLFYSYIEENFSYSDVSFLHSALTPQRASRTLQTKLGDCKDLSTLFVAMCLEAGINANLVLVDTRDNGDKNLDIPTIGFNHCIAQLKTDNKSYLVELTNKNLPFGTLTNTLINANGLFIPRETETATAASLSKLNTNNRPLNTIDRQTGVNFIGKNVGITRRTRRSGAEASALRESYRDNGDEDNRKDVSESLSGEFNKKVVLKDMKMTNLDNLSDTMIFEDNFTVDNFVSELVGMQVFTLPWSDSYKSIDFISAEERTYPFTFWKFSSTPYDREVMTITVPTGKKLAEIPANISFACSVMSYDLSFQIKGEKIIAIREVKYLKEQLLPSEYAAFKEFITKMSAADAKQFAYK